jgi:hypothetical protein
MYRGYATREGMRCRMGAPRNFLLTFVIIEDPGDESAVALS